MKVRFGSSPDADDTRGEARRKKGRAGVFDAILDRVGMEGSDVAGEVAVVEKRTARSVLAEIAAETDLRDPAAAAAAVRRSAASLLRLSFAGGVGAVSLPESVLEGVADLAADDPLFRRRMLAILSRLQGER